MSKLLSTCPDEHFEKKYFLRNYKIWYLIWERRLFWNLAKKCWQGCQNCILRAQRNILRKNSFFFQKKIILFHLFRTLSQIFLNVDEKNSAGLSSSILRVLSNILRKYIFSEKLITFIISGLLAKTFRQDNQNSISSVQRNISVFSKKFLQFEQSLVNII